MSAFKHKATLKWKITESLYDDFTKTADCHKNQIMIRFYYYIKQPGTEIKSLVHSTVYKEGFYNVPTMLPSSPTEFNPWMYLLPHNFIQTPRRQMLVLFVSSPAA